MQVQIYRAKLVFLLFVFVAHLFKVYLNRKHVFGAKLLMTHLLRIHMSRGTIVLGPIA